MVEGGSSAPIAFLLSLQIHKNLMLNESCLLCDCVTKREKQKEKGKCNNVTFLILLGLSFQRRVQ